MQFILDEWLSELIQRKTYCVKHEMYDLTDEKLDEIIRSYLQIDKVFLYAKIQATFLEMIHFYQKAGFRIADVNIVFVKRINHRTSIDSDSIRFSAPKDQSMVKELARQSFKYSRFHMDQELESDQADMIKAEWANNFFLGKRGNWMIIAEHNEKVIGFLLLLKGEKNSLVIDLIAVDSTFRGQGVASKMIKFAETKLKTFETIQAGTQIVNFSSIQLYEKLGFRACKSYYVLHYHNIDNSRK